MSDIAIRVEGLSKQYRIGARKERYRTFRDTLAGVFSRRSAHTDKKETFWALKDVSFEVRRGEVAGIIGRNGAGKSTLLKILSRITEPSTGYAKIHGRVGSLLEVGTGFHPELTGRENIYLNGAILGMRRNEIARNFDEIVDFAQVEKFIDTPVKHYSSGMYLRLAFAVAAHLEPELLFVDEVLAVGDLAFQKKCLQKMDSVARTGRTVLLVSHNMGVIRSLCGTGILLEGGAVAFAGNISRCIETYANGTKAADDKPGARPKHGLSFGPIVINGEPPREISPSEPMGVATTLQIPEPVAGFTLFCLLEDTHGRTVFHLREESPTLGFQSHGSGDFVVAVRLPALWLNPGLYSVYFKVILWGEYGNARCVSDKQPIDFIGTSSAAECVLHPRARWQFSFADSAIVQL